MKYSVKLAARDVAECSLFVALMAAGAYIKIPFPTMPLTFQTAISILAGLLLGAKKGVISMAAYALTGLIGIPVFTGGGGLHYVTLPSFGYVLGFIAAAGISGLSYGSARHPVKTLLLSVAALIADYIFGIAYFIAVWQLSGYEGLWHAVVAYNLIYIPKDALLAVLSAALANTLTPALCKMRGSAPPFAGKRRADK